MGNNLSENALLCKLCGRLRNEQTHPAVSGSSHYGNFYVKSYYNFYNTLLGEIVEI
jgi:hypothetical protein